MADNNVKVTVEPKKTGFNELSVFLKAVVVFVCIQMFFVGLAFLSGVYTGLMAS